MRIEYRSEVVCSMCNGRIPNDYEVPNLCFVHKRDYFKKKNAKSNTVFRKG